jgi:hypothetical protein
MQSATQSVTRNFYGRSRDAVIRVYDGASNMMDTHRHKGNPPKRSSRKRRGRQCDGLFDFC